MEVEENVADMKESEGIISLVPVSGADMGFDHLAVSRYDQVLMPSPGQNMRRS